MRGGRACSPAGYDRFWSAVACHRFGLRQLAAAALARRWQATALQSGSKLPHSENSPAPEALLIVLDRRFDHFHCVCGVVHAGDLDRRCLSRDHLVGAEVMFEAFDENRWELAHLLNFAPDVIAEENGDDLV